MCLYLAKKPSVCSKSNPLCVICHTKSQGNWNFLQLFSVTQQETVSLLEVMKALLIFALLSLASVSYAQNCATCELLVTGIESWLSNNATEAEIEQNLQQLCSLVPAFQQVVRFITFDNVLRKFLSYSLAV